MELEFILELVKESVEVGEAPATQAIRAWVMTWDGDEEVPDLVAEWVGRRQEILAIGADLIERLEEVHRTPNYHDVVEGNANFPPWHGDPNWTTLCFHPWAEDYEQALEACKGFLDE